MSDKAATPNSKNFAHLHQHTAYSLLDGAARINDLMAWVKEVSADKPVVAMTDHGNMHGAVQFYKSAEDHGVKPIIGFEAYVAAGSMLEKKRANNKLDGGYFHLTLLAKNFKGYQNLCKLNSEGWLDGFYGKPRVDHDALTRYSEGVIALSGCLGAQIPRHLLDLGEEAGAKMLEQYLAIYGDNFFIELQNHVPDNPDMADPKLADLVEQQRRLNPMLKTLANKFGLGMVATNDGHYVKKEDAKAHEALLAIQTKTTLADEKRFRFPCEEFYVKTPAEMAKAIPESEYGGALDNSMTIADMCDLELPIGKRRVYQMPELPLPEGRTLAVQLRVQSYQGLMARYQIVDEAFIRDYVAEATSEVPADLEQALVALARVSEAGRVEQQEDENFDHFVYPHLERFKASGANEEALIRLARCEFELGVIIAMGFPDYFLIVADFINWAKAQGIAVGPGRGSGAGSIVAYSLSITNIDPLAYDLLFERFLNPDRVSMPDFDIDFDDVRRSEVIDYVRQKYGDDRVAHIATFGTMASKAAIKDAARVLEAPYADADKVSKLIPVVFGRSTPIAKALEEVPDIAQHYNAEETTKEFMDVAMSLEGLTRHASVHAAGVIIARDPIQELAPVFRSGDGPIVCQYDMGSIEDLGFIKMDFLGLRTLSFIEAAVRIIKDSRGIDIVPDDFPLDDEATFELLSKGDAAGVFQFEGAGMVDTLKRLKPRRVQDLIAVSALYRPGPMENIPTYIRRHHGQEAVTYEEFPQAEHILTPILAETYGIPVYQEQIMQIATAVAGYSLGEADLLRRAMGKKKVKEMETHRAIFEKGAKEREVPAKEANGIFDLLEKFANYGFNKCIHGDTLILDANSGQRHRAATLFEQQQLTVVSQDHFQLNHRPTVSIMRNGIKPLFELHTVSGKRIKATANHPFLTLDGWRELANLSVGQRIASPARLDLKATQSWPAHQLKLLGWVLSEGNTCHPCGAYVYSQDETIVADVVEAASHFENTKATVNMRPERHHTYDIYLGTGKRGSASQGRSGARLWLEQLGSVGQKAHEKHFPEDVFCLKNQDLALLLGRYWSGDGFVAGQGNLTPYAATSSQRLAEELQHLLLRFGIISTVTLKNFAYKEGRQGYTVHLLGRRSIEAFVSHIAPHILAKDKQLSCLNDYLANTSADQESIDTLPVEVKFWVQREKENSGLTWRELEANSGVSMKEFYGGLNAHKRGFRRQTIRRLATFFNSERLHMACSEDLFWESIVSIEPVGEAMTYDLEVADSHNFVANDLLVHNSHSAAYGMLSYQTAYLKTHYPVEFTAALLTVERANSDKVAEYVADARHMGIEVLPPDVNASRADFTPVDEVVRFGLYGIKNVGDAAVEHILDNRQQHGKFKDLYDFCERIDSSLVNRRALEHLIKAGAFDRLGDRTTMLYNVEAAVQWGTAQRQQASLGQMSLFGADETRPAEVQAVDGLSKLELLTFEKDALGLYITDHPMNSYPGLAAAASCKIDKLESWFKQQDEEGSSGRLRVVLAGILQNVAKKPTKSGNMYARFEVADESGSRELLAFSRTYEDVADKLVNEAPVVVVATIDLENDSLRVVTEKLIRWDNRENLPEVAVAEFNLGDVDEAMLMDFRSSIDEYAGRTPLQLKVKLEQGTATYAAERLLVDKHKLSEIEALCPWLTTTITLDKRSLLYVKPRTYGYQNNQQQTSQKGEVPF